MTRQRDLLCSATDCGRNCYARNLCRMHYKRLNKHGDLLERKRRWSGDEVTYGGMHKRLVLHRGPAREHACLFCGDSAGQWAYDHSDPNEKQSNDGPYSTDESRYLPLCRPCHVRLDERRLVVV